MSKTTSISCACGQTCLELQGDPILVSECLCDSCRTAADRLAMLPGAKSVLTSYGATPSAEYRKDRVRILSGADRLREFRLSAHAGSRRVVATCCNTPVFLEMKGALAEHLSPPLAGNRAAEGRAANDGRRPARRLQPAPGHSQFEKPYSVVLCETAGRVDRNGIPKSED